MDIDTRKQKIEDSYPGMVARLGQESDAEIAKNYKVSTSLVWRYRTELGIKPITWRSDSHDTTWRNDIVRHLREQWQEQTGGTYEELATQLGVVGASRLGDWAYGRRQPQIETIFALAALCDRHLVIRDGAVIVRARKVRESKADEVFSVGSWLD